jgi:hypothetical protein
MQLERMSQSEKGRRVWGGEEAEKSFSCHSYVLSHVITFRVLGQGLIEVSLSLTWPVSFTSKVRRASH